MKKINIKIYHLLMLLLGALFISSCSNDKEQDNVVRLFRPVLNMPLSAANNTVIVNMGKLKSATSYRVEISRDNFATLPLKTIESTDPYVVFDNLLWNTLYQVRAIALASDEELNSRVANFGEIKTERFPSILNIPASIDIIDVGLNVRWSVSGNPVTKLKIFSAEDEELLTPLASYDTSSGQQLDGLMVVKKLTPLTNYTVAIYSGTNGETLRGFEKFITKAALPTSGNIIDLRGDDSFDPVTDNGTYLKGHIDNAMAMTGGATVILDGDQTYKISGVVLTNNISILSGYSLTAGGAVLNLTGDVQIATNAKIDKISFNGLKIIGSQNYFIYPRAANTGIEINTLEFSGCTINNIRGVARMQPVGLLNNYIIDNCIVNTIGDNGIYKSDGNNFVCKNFTIKNSTFYKVNRGIINTTPNASGSATISDCTFIESIFGSFLIDYNAANTVLNDLIIKNTILGPGSGGTPYGTGPFTALRIVRNAPSLTVFDNVWDTTDVTYSGIVPANILRYSGTFINIFTDPVNANFKIKDASFVGKSTAGDPRWRL